MPPLYFSKSCVQDDKLDCCYFWQFKPEAEGGFLPLLASKIVAIEPLEQGFRVRDIIELSEAKRKS